jgi:hypothetical protein
MGQLPMGTKRNPQINLLVEIRILAGPFFLLVLWQKPTKPAKNRPAIVESTDIYGYGPAHSGLIDQRQAHCTVAAMRTPALSDPVCVAGRLFGMKL